MLNVLSITFHSEGAHTHPGGVSEQLVQEVVSMGGEREGLTSSYHLLPTGSSLHWKVTSVCFWIVESDPFSGLSDSRFHVLTCKFYFIIEVKGVKRSLSNSQE